MARRIGGWLSLLLVPALLTLCRSAGAAYPPGSRIAFAVNVGADGRTSRIYVANPDGSGVRTLTNGTARDRAPDFSPDGHWLAFQSTNELGLDTVLVKEIDGDAPPRAITAGMAPQWSRDGKRLLFSRRQVNDYLLYQIRVDGTQKESDLKAIGKGLIGRWSPDEKRLAAVTPVILAGQDRWQVQVLEVGSFLPRFTLTLPESYGQVVSLDWSPNGQSLLFSVMHQGRYDLYVSDLKSPEPRRLPRADGSPRPVPNPGYGSWSPDGQEILFRSGEEAVGDMPSHARLMVMKADGTQVRTIWEPSGGAFPIHGTAWFGSRGGAPVVVTVPPKPAPPAVKPPDAKTPPVVPPMPAPMPAPVQPALVLGPPRKVNSGKIFNIAQPRSPVSVRLASPGPSDFVITVPVLPNGRWSPRKQGVGITLELEDGGLYRGTVIFSGSPWATIQGRPKGGRVRLIDGKQLPPELGGFGKGFSLTVRRQGPNLAVLVDDKEVLSRPVLTSPVKAAFLTLENFDAGQARFPLGNIYYRRWEEAPKAPSGG